jgi:hypothetical protein
VYDKRPFDILSVDMMLANIAQIWLRRVDEQHDVGPPRIIDQLMNAKLVSFCRGDESPQLIASTIGLRVEPRRGRQSKDSSQFNYRAMWPADCRSRREDIWMSHLVFAKVLQRPWISLSTDQERK